jgi:hypothetical protein
MFCDVAWILKLLYELLGATYLSFNTLLLFLRLSWAFLIIQYQSLTLFIQSLAQKKPSTNLIDKTCLFISSSIVTYFGFIALYGTPFTTPVEFDNALRNTTVGYTSFEVPLMR